MLPLFVCNDNVTCTSYTHDIYFRKHRIYIVEYNTFMEQQTPPIEPVSINTTITSSPYGDKKKIYVHSMLGVIILGLLFLGYILYSYTNLWNGVEPLISDIPSQQKTTQALIKDVSQGLPNESDTLDRMTRLQENLPLYAGTTDTTHTKDRMNIRVWTEPQDSKVYAAGEKFAVTGAYTVPADFAGRIWVTRNGQLFGQYMIDNRGKEEQNGDFRIDMGVYVPGPQTYVVHYDGAAACRLVCSPSDTDCQKNDARYCVASETNQEFAQYAPRTLGEQDFVSEKTCLTKTFTSGPRAGSASNSCSTEGFKDPYHVLASAFIQSFALATTTRDQFAADVAAHYKAVREGGEGRTIERSMDAVSWKFTYTDSNAQSQCTGETIVKINCPSE